MQRRGLQLQSKWTPEPLNLQHSSCHLSHRVSRPCPIHLPIPHPALHLKMGIFLSKKKNLWGLLALRVAFVHCGLWSVDSSDDVPF